MHEEYGFAFVQVWKVYVYLPVESSCAQQCLVENVDAVCCSQHYYARVRSETVHLGEQLVECVFALVVAAHRRVLSAGAAHGVYFVDEND